MTEGENEADLNRQSRRGYERRLVAFVDILGRTAMSVAGLLSERERVLALVPEFIRSHHKAALKVGDHSIAKKVLWFADYYNHTIGREPETGLKPVCLQSSNGDSCT